MRASALAEAEAMGTSSPRRTWLFDTFRGIPVDTAAAGGFEEPVDAWPERYACSHSEVMQHFARFGVFDPDEVVGVEGLFNETSTRPDVANELRRRGLAVLHIDGDSYASVASALTGFESHIRQGGFGIVEDYHLPSARAAVVDHFAALREATILRFVRDPRGSRSRNGVGGKNAFWRRRGAGEDKGVSPDDASAIKTAHDALRRAGGRAARVSPRASLPPAGALADAIDAVVHAAGTDVWATHYDARSTGWSLLLLRSVGGRLDDRRSNAAAGEFSDTPLLDLDASGQLAAVLRAVPCAARARRHHAAGARRRLGLSRRCATCGAGLCARAPASPGWQKRILLG